MGSHLGASSGVHQGLEPTMDIRLGTCGWSFADWKGTFYPLGTKDELAYYTSRFDAVEIDSTYYRVSAAVGKAGCVPGLRPRAQASG
jgi:hypothetical protein